MSAGAEHSGGRQQGSYAVQGVPGSIASERVPWGTEALAAAVWEPQETQSMLQDSVKELKASVQSLEDKLRKAETRAEVAQRERREDGRVAEAAATQLRDQCDKVQTENSSLQSRLSALSTQHAAASVHLEQARAAVTAGEEASKQLQQKCDQQQHSTSLLKDQLRRAQSKVELLEDKVKLAHPP
jgi:chromosome segregation ATPase